MGNLYTRVKRRHDPRINTLTKLKQAYRNTPRDYGVINNLKAQLHKIEKNWSKPKRQRIKELGTIAYYQRLKANSPANVLNKQGS